MTPAQKLFTIATAGVLTYAGYRATRYALRPTNVEAEPVSALDYTNEYRMIDWNKVRYFQPGEFQGQADDVDPQIVYAVDELRRRLGVPVLISPARGAVARYDADDKDSQHYAVGRKSTALDIMVPDKSLVDVYNAAKTIAAIGGIGLYPDWSPHPGAHIDTRPRKADGTIARWMGYDTSAGQQYAAIDLDFINQRERGRA